MKKVISILLALFVFVGCGSDGRVSKSEKILTQEEFKNCFTIINVTVDNWKDYFEVGSYIDPVEGNEYATLELKDEYMENLCGNPDIYFYFNISYHQTSSEYNSDTGELMHTYNDRDEIDTREISVYPKRDRREDRYYYQNPIMNTAYKYSYGYDSYYNCNVESRQKSTINDIVAMNVTGQLCYANYPEDSWNTNSYDERYVCFQNERGTKYSVFENGLLRWDRGSGFGYENQKDLYSLSYYDFFEE